MCTQNFGQKGRPLGSFDKNSVWIIITPVYAYCIKQSELLLLVKFVSAFHKVPVIIVTSWGTDVLLLPSQFIIIELKSNAVDQW